MVLADPGLLERVVANLVDNAHPPRLGRVSRRDPSQLHRDSRGFCRRRPRARVSEEIDWDRMFVPFQRLR